MSSQISRGIIMLSSVYNFAW